MSLLSLPREFRSCEAERNNCKLLNYSLHIDFLYKKKPSPDVLLICQVGSILYRRNHAFDSEKGCQVCCVAGDDDECEEPPDSAHNSSACRLRDGFLCVLIEGRIENQF